MFYRISTYRIKTYQINTAYSHLTNCAYSLCSSNGKKIIDEISFRFVINAQLDNLIILNSIDFNGTHSLMFGRPWKFITPEIIFEQMSKKHDSFHCFATLLLVIKDYQKFEHEETTEDMMGYVRDTQHMIVDLLNMISRSLNLKYVVQPSEIPLRPTVEEILDGNFI